jgi:hypothetical protein
VWERPRGSIIKFAEADDIRLAQFHDIVEEHGPCETVARSR